jgi:hypothetical protein
MPNNVRTWQAIKRAAIEGEQADKRVVRSDFSRIRSMRIDQEATGSTRISYELSGMWFGQSVFRDTTYETLEIPGAGNIQIEGEPELPQEGLFVAIPENADFAEVRRLEMDVKEIPGEHLVRPASRPVRETERPEYFPNRGIYGSNRAYPGNYFQFLGTKRVAGRKVAHIMVYPVEYHPRSKSLLVLKSILLEVRYGKEVGRDEVATHRIMQATPTDSLILDSESQLRAERHRLRSEPDSGFDAPRLKNRRNKGEYLVITTDILKPSVEPLVNARAHTCSVKVVTKAEIDAEFNDNTEDVAIRNFLKYASDNWKEPPKWVVLAGDTPDLPTHLQKFELEPGPLASDHFYSDLRGDLIPELVISRLATSNPAEMERICERAAASGQHDTPWANKILFLTFREDDYVECTEQLAVKVGNRYQVTKVFNGQNTKEQVKVLINDGIGLINYRGHGRKTEWLDGLNTNDVSQLMNGDKLPVVLSIACSNNYIDIAETSFGECWVRNEKAIAFLGASRDSYTVPNQAFDKFLFEAIIDEGLTVIGDIMNFGKTKLCQQSTGSGEVRDNVRMYLLLGDPCSRFGTPGG